MNIKSVVAALAACVCVVGNLSAKEEKLSDSMGRDYYL